MTVSYEEQEREQPWLDRPFSSFITINIETLIFIIILIVAIFSRFYDLESRVMSHDENSHVYFSWLFEQGSGYSHDPVTHGPFQFHVVALSYFMFGDTDFTARIPAALFSIATIFFMWQYRKLLGRRGSVIAAILFLISPYVLYYGRYVRNEAFVAFFGVVTLWAILRYLESGAPRYLFWLTAIISLHFVTKETSFIYAAQALLFLAFYLLYQVTLKPWYIPAYRNRFLVLLILSLVLLSTAGAFLVLSDSSSLATGTETVSPAIPGEQTIATAQAFSPVPIILVAIGLICIIAAIYFAIRGYTWGQLKNERSFALLVLLGTLILPLLAAFPVKFIGINPIDYQSNQTILADTIAVILFALIATAVGLVWNPRLWLANAALFYAIFIVFYTSLFTNGFGFMTGLVGSLGYWLEQQGVNRGSQPWYYYWFVQLPIYEFLPYLGTLLALIFARKLVNSSNEDVQRDSTEYSELNESDNLVEIENDTTTMDVVDKPPPGMTIALLLFWSFTSLVAYTIAGEKMPWLSVHIAVPMILTTAWFLGRLIDTFDWNFLRNSRGVIVILLAPIFIMSTLTAVGTLLGPNPPFQGKELNQLQATSTFLFSLLTAVASGWGLARLVKGWNTGQLVRVFTLVTFFFLGILTARAAIMAAYINYDYATEFLVYAHSAPGDKTALTQIEEISRRTTDGLDIKVAYDSDTSYPYWWYLRNYRNKEFFGSEPTRALRDSVAILVGEANFGKIDPVVGQAYHRFDYIRLWWPNQDYFGLTLQRVISALTNPQMRAALFDIWLNRDYTRYAQVTNKDLSLQNWWPSSKMRLYIRKDVVSSLWNYGVVPAPEEVIADPYEGKQVTLIADTVLGNAGSEPGQFKRPRDLAVAQDGSVYVVDTENHRIQHLAPDGTLLNIWGSFTAGTDTNQAPGGTFNEPWGIDIGPDGSIYIADTWNNRIQKFDSAGNFLATWGYGISQTDDPYGFYGPRDVAVNSQGHVFVSDTGNKRIVVFESDGTFLTSFGGAGFGPGQFDEPVGIAIDSNDQVYVADTWNQRIQVFSLAPDGTYIPSNSWDIAGWYGQSIDNKPYLDVAENSLIYITDPEGYRILEFTNQGAIIKYWGDFSTGADGFSLAGAVHADPDGGVWVTDTDNNRIMHFNPNTVPSP